MHAVMDKKWMRYAVKLAQKAYGKTHPNPPVGCVIVSNNEVLGYGYHEKAGMPHAEQIALKQCSGRELGNATCYVTLEPCNHHGRTAPCTDRIIQSGLRRVVISVRDPNPGVSGGGVEKLRAAGIQVDCGILEDEGKALIECWVKWVCTGKPFVLLKSACSLDGKVATCSGQSQWISNETSRRRAHVLRGKYDAIMAGKNTIREDNPRLTARRGAYVTAAPLRIVLDSHLSLPLSSKVFQQDLPGKTLVVTGPNSDPSKEAELTRRKIDMLKLSLAGGVSPGVDLEQLMIEVGRIGIESILVEGGPTLAFSLLQNDLVDKICYFLAPVFIGGRTALSALEGEGFPSLDRIPKLIRYKTRRLNGDLMIEGYLHDIFAVAAKR